MKSSISRSAASLFTTEENRDEGLLRHRAAPQSAVAAILESVRAGSSGP